jgi:hypothetical protein
MGCCCGNNEIKIDENQKNDNNIPIQNILYKKNNDITIQNDNDDNENENYTNYNNNENIETLSLNNNEINVDNHINLQILSNSRINKSIILNKNNNNKKKIEESGFQIESNIKYISLSIKAEYFLKEKILPIWFNKDEYAKFIVKGKWRIGPTYPLTDSKGIPTTYSVNFNYGALLGRIGKENCFLIKDSTAQYTENGGQLTLRMNLPKLNSNIKPSGILYIKIFDGIIMNQTEINKRIGWLEMSKLSENKSFNETEQLVINNLNNLRMNPVLFYEKNIETYKNMVLTKEFLLNLKFNEKRRPFKIFETPIKKIKDYFEYKFDKKSFYKTYSKTYATSGLEKLEYRLDLYLEDVLKTDNYILNCKFTKSKNPMEICLCFLFDEGIRDYIFHINFLRISLIIIKNFCNEDNLIILVLFKGIN